MPLILGGLGTGRELGEDAGRGTWSNWSDTPMLPGGLFRGWPPDHCGRRGTKSIASDGWEVLSSGLRPEEGRRVKHRKRDPMQPRHGWQIGLSALHIIPNMS